MKNKKSKRIDAVLEAWWSVIDSSQRFLAFKLWVEHIDKNDKRR